MMPLGSEWVRESLWTLDASLTFNSIFLTISWRYCCGRRSLAWSWFSTKKKKKHTKTDAHELIHKSGQMTGLWLSSSGPFHSTWLRHFTELRLSSHDQREARSQNGHMPQSMKMNSRSKPQPENKCFSSYKPPFNQLKALQSSKSQHLKLSQQKDIF